MVLLAGTFTRSSCPTWQNHCSSGLSAIRAAKSRKLPHNNVRAIVHRNARIECSWNRACCFPPMRSSSRITPHLPSPESSIPNKSQNNIITHTYNVIHLRSLLSILYLARFLGFEGFFPNYCDSSATEPISSLFRDKALAL